MNLGAIDYPAPEIEAPPRLTSDECGERFARLRQAMVDAGFDYLAVYGDREHFANVAFLTGYDPRFEESVLLVSATSALLLVGNEGQGYAKNVMVAPGVDLGLCPTLSLYGQPRDLTKKGKSLPEWVNTFGITAGANVGLVGAKSFSGSEMRDPVQACDVPLFVVQPIWDASGKSSVANAADLLVHPSDGLRTGGFLTSAHEVARFESAAERSYAAVLRLMTNIRTGMTEEAAAALLGFTGAVPLSYHIALGFGERHVMAGLGSPDPSVTLRLGDPVTFGFGLWGANIARTGMGVSEAGELPREASGYLHQLAEPYFRCLKNWYEALEIGAAGGDVYDRVRWFVEDEAFGVGLNPGHLIHLDEWPATPFASDSTERLRSGMFIQCDIIPAPDRPLFGIHTEDGIMLADDKLRGEIATEYPSVWRRIQRRREMVCDQIGIELRSEVLPMSSMTACCCPFLLSPTRVFCA